ncbi:UNVERIFIED_CONTAM: hypothetical protein FKN15_034683 [Acipenser sinensis]
MFRLTDGILNLRTEVLGTARLVKVCKNGIIQDKCIISVQQTQMKTVFMILKTVHSTEDIYVKLL